MRTVNVHEAKTQFSRLIDAAHAGETILVAKDGKPWARLVPLETDRPRRQPGLLRGQLQLPPIEVLLAPLPPEELDALEADGRSSAGRPNAPPAPALQRRLASAARIHSVMARA